MSLDWYPAIRECCLHWRDAPMLQQTYEALDKNFIEDNDACIDCAKCIVETVCQIIIDELDDPSDPKRPNKTSISFTDWVSATVMVLKLGRSADEHIRDLTSAHSKLADALGKLRNSNGPVSHGRPPFLDRLSQHHRRAAVLAADAIVALFHQAYLVSTPNFITTREPYERFETQNTLIDDMCAFRDAEISEDGLLEVVLAIPGVDAAELIKIKTLPSQFLFYNDRQAYIEALNAAQAESARVAIISNVEAI